ncbi:TrbI/VirB10 family protein [Massilia sp.]|uniref:TrbI/VirB10 family protein n=1 Tax=Massilia sp. TaxID=1882437 RepID=UPI00352F99E5
MSNTGQVAKYKQQWEDMDPKFKWAMGAIVIGGAILMGVRSKERAQDEQEDQARKVAQATVQANAKNGQALPNSANNFSALPTSNRNQGLEDLMASLQKAREDAKEAQEHSKNVEEQVRKLSERLGQLDTRAPAAASSGGYGTSAYANGAAGGNASGTGPAYENLPPPVDFGQPGTNAPAKPGEKTPFSDAAIPEEPQVQARPTAMHVWPAEVKPAAVKRKEDAPQLLTLPINSALESVMLTGINARSNSAGGAASGTILSANNVGAPFVSKIKGNAILPNGWKVSDFNDCFISGTGIAILSSERANVIANVMSCIDKRGNVYEAKVKAYGVDLDGIQGIAGRVVTKQGSLLAKTALAGVASGLGSAFSPTALPSYNQNAQSGDRQGIQYPNPNLIAGSALGGGISEAGRALSRFYLDYAKEMFPVIEVNAGTRITWILQESVELNQMKKAN